MLAAGGVFYLTRPARLARLTGDLLNQLSAAKVQITSAKIHLDGSIELRGVKFTVPSPQTLDLPESGDTQTTPNDTAPFPAATPASQPGTQPSTQPSTQPTSPQTLELFEVDVVLIRHDLTSLLQGKFNARSITFIQPKLYLTEDLDHNVFNYQLLQDAKKNDDQDKSNLPDTLPEVFIRQGSIQFGEIVQGQYATLGTINLSGGLSTMPGQKNVYSYLLRQDADAASGNAAPPRATPSLSGQFNLDNLAVTAKLDRFTFEGSHRQVLPRKLRLWWDQYDPKGSLPEVEFGYDPTLGMHAVLEVKDASLTLPYSDPPVRMSNVSGKFTVVGETAAVTQLRGEIENIGYEINGQIDGLDSNSPFKMSVRISKFNIPQEPRYLLALPRVVQKQFSRFAPSGTFSAMVNIERAVVDGDIQYDGQVEVENASGVYAKFPYPLSDVRGELRFNNKEVRIIGLHGNGLGGGHVTITGFVAPPRDDARVQIDISGTDIPIDEHLYAALDEDELEVVNGFFDHKAAKRLEQRGLIQTKEKKEHVLEQINALTQRKNNLVAKDPTNTAALKAIDDELEALAPLALVPVFDLGGKVNIQVSLVREYGPDEPYLPTTVIDTSRVSVLTEAWNYPLQITGGKLLLSPGLATLQNIQAQGLDGLKGVVTGKVALPRKSVPGSKSDPDVRFDGSGLPVSNLLLSSLPDTQAKWLEQLNVKGLLKLQGKVYRIKDTSNDGQGGNDEANDGPMDFDVHATMVDGKAQPFDGRVLLEKIAGKFLIHRNSAVIESVTSDFGDASMSLAGTAAWKNKKTDMKLAITAKDVDFTQQVLDLVPSYDAGIEQVRKDLKDYQPTGRYDADVTINLPHGQDPDYLVKVNPKSLGFNHNEQRVTFSSVKGQVRIDPAKVIIDHCLATFDKTSQATFNGLITLGPKPRWTLDINATGKRFDPTTMALLPKGVSQFAKDVELDGGYELQNGKLLYQPRDEKTIDFKGQARLINAKASLGVTIEDFQGLMKIDTHQMANEEWPVVKVELEAARLTAADRLIEQLNAELHSTQTPGELVIPKIRGQIYNGQLLGEAQIQLGKDPTFKTQLTVQDAAVEAIVEPKKWETMAARDPLDGSPYAILSASLAMQGQPNVPESRQGRGKIDIRQANLYQTPFALTFLQLLSLALPTATSFDRARASYVIDGDVVRFDSIRFETPSLALAGTGTMHFSTMALDLNFVTRSTANPTFGPVSDLISVLKDEVVAIHVGGTVEKPVTSVKSFSGITKTWQDLFGDPNAQQKLQASPAETEQPK